MSYRSPSREKDDYSWDVRVVQADKNKYWVSPRRSPRRHDRQQFGKQPQSSAHWAPLKFRPIEIGKRSRDRRYQDSAPRKADIDVEAKSVTKDPIKESSDMEAACSSSIGRKHVQLNKQKDTGREAKKTHPNIKIQSIKKSFASQKIILKYEKMRKSWKKSILKCTAA